LAFPLSSPQRICFCRSRSGSAFAVPAADLLLPFPQRICFLPFFIAIATVAGWPILRGLIAKGGLFAPRANRLLFKHRKIVIQTAPFNATQTISILSAAKNPCISSLLLLSKLHLLLHSHLHVHLRLHLHLLLLLPVPAVILNAVKDPEETIQQPPCESFQPIPSPRLPLPSLCLLAVILRQRRRIYSCSCRK
jgi:hypothetical protein